jgi:hypothetical protein
MCSVLVSRRRCRVCVVILCVQCLYLTILSASFFIKSFTLPDPAGRAGGALTSALLKVTYDDHKNTGKDLSFMETLLQVRGILKQKGYEQIPQLSSSRPMDITKNFDLVPDHMSGTRRAVMM